MKDSSSFGHERKKKSTGIMYLLSAQDKKFPPFFPASLQHPVSPCWPVLLLMWDLTRLESRWFGCRQNNSSFYGNSSASPLTMAFRSLLSNRGDFPSSLEPSQQQSHPHRNHLAFCNSRLTARRFQLLERGKWGALGRNIPQSPLLVMLLKSLV